MSLKRIAVSILLTVFCLGVFVLPVSAAYMEHDGLEITIVTDKETYDAGEPITATITVKNTNSGSTTITNLEQLIPEGYRLSESSEASMKNVTLRGGQELIMNVTFVQETTAEAEVAEDFLTNLIEGQTLGIPNLLWALLLVIAFVIYMLLT